LDWIVERRGTFAVVVKEETVHDGVCCIVEQAQESTGANLTDESDESERTEGNGAEVEADVEPVQHEEGLSQTQVQQNDC